MASDAVGYCCYFIVFFSDNTIKRILLSVKFCILASDIVDNKNSYMVSIASSTKTADTAGGSHVIQFDFYDELPALNVQSLALKRESKDVSLYILRLASFMHEHEASQLRLSLLLAGIDADIVKKGAMYIVQRGFYPTVAEAKMNQKALKKKGIDSVIEDRMAL